MICRGIGDHIHGVRKILALFNISQTNATGAINIQQQIKTMTGDNKPHPAADCSLDVKSLGDDDGIDAEAEALVVLDDVGGLKRQPRCHDTTLWGLNVEVRGILDIILQDVPHAVIELVEVGLLRSPPTSCASLTGPTVMLWACTPSSWNVMLPAG